MADWAKKALRINSFHVSDLLGGMTLLQKNEPSWSKTMGVKTALRPL